MSPTRTLMVREFEVIRSQSVFMIELVGELLLPLILLGIYALTGVLGELEGMASQVATSPYLPYGLFFAIALMSSISMLSSTSVSRQGPLFALDRVMPLSPKQFVKAKLALHLCLIGSSTLVYLILSLLFFRLSLGQLVWMVPLTVLVVFSNGAFGLSIDYKRPLLTWSIPQQAMKSNMNGLLGMLSSLGVLAVLAVAMFVPLALGAMSILGIALSFLAASVLCLLAWKTALRNAYSAFFK